MRVISDCRYFEFAVNSVFLNENKMNDGCEKLVVIDMRNLSSPEEALKRLMHLSDTFGEHYFVLIGHSSLLSPASYHSDFFIDAGLCVTDFVHQLLNLTRRKITFSKYTSRLTGLIHHKDISKGIILTNMEKKIRSLVFKNLSVANIASRLALSNKTIYSHLNNMKSKYQAHSLNFLYLKIQNGESPSKQQNEAIIE